MSRGCTQVIDFMDTQINNFTPGTFHLKVRQRRLHYHEISECHSSLLKTPVIMAMLFQGESPLKRAPSCKEAQNYSGGDSKEIKMGYCQRCRKEAFKNRSHGFGKRWNRFKAGSLYSKIHSKTSSCFYERAGKRILFDKWIFITLECHEGTIMERILRMLFSHVSTECQNK